MGKIVIGEIVKKKINPKVKFQTGLVDLLDTWKRVAERKKHDPNTSMVVEEREKYGKYGCGVTKKI